MTLNLCDATNNIEAPYKQFALTEHAFSYMTSGFFETLNN